MRKALLWLGNFSMMSGQWEKAVDRFSPVESASSGSRDLHTEQGSSAYANRGTLPVR